MKRIITLICLLVCTCCYGQLYDAQWALGYDESVLDFRTADTVLIDTLPTLQYFFLTNASICDENGNLLYYTNGVSVCGINSILQNGTGLSNSAYSSDDSLDGLNIRQGVIFIPKPGSSRYYYLIHSANDALNGTRPGTIYYSLIDKEANGGLGAVIEKNQTLITGSIYREGGITACKHANGRDYWLVFGASDTNMFYKFLITPDGIIGPFTQNIGPNYPLPYNNAYSKFSQDGSKYVTGTIVGSILVMDFDRCSGEFSNPITIFNSASSDTAISGCVAVEFSPNNRFVYASDNVNLTQYDLWSSNIQDSTQLFLEDSITRYGIDLLQVAPNGKLYGSDWNGGIYALHVVNYPDLKGDSCNFIYGGQPTLTENSVNLPNLINYKLGPLIGSGCDSLPNSITVVKPIGPELRVMPNPADKYIYVEMGMPAPGQSGRQGNYEFDLLNTNGQLLDKRETPQVDYFDTEHLPAGSYFLRVSDKYTGKEIGGKEVVVVH